MVAQIALIAVGLALLLVAGDLLVRGAVSLARALRVPALIVSLTIVAFGTSAPELVVAIQAVLAGKAGIAIGNIIGSNIANILLVIGLPAVIYPISAHVQGLRRHATTMLVATAAFAALAYGPGTISPATGAALFAGIVLYVSYMGLRARAANGDAALLDDVSDYAEGDGFSPRIIVYLAAGLVGLPLGAHLLVENGADLAAQLGVRDEVIGLTIVAFGTSLPELATVVAAAMHRKSDVAMGNIIGSNIFNILAVGGAAGLAGGATFDPMSLQFDLPIMIASAIAFSAYVYGRHDIGRTSGVAMFLGYTAFVVALAAKASA